LVRIELSINDIFCAVVAAPLTEDWSYDCVFFIYLSALVKYSYVVNLSLAGFS
jgi:hypothetical protein